MGDSSYFLTRSKVEFRKGYIKHLFVLVPFLIGIGSYVFVLPKMFDVESSIYQFAFYSMIGLLLYMYYRIVLFFTARHHQKSNNPISVFTGVLHFILLCFFLGLVGRTVGYLIFETGENLILNFLEDRFMLILGSNGDFMSALNVIYFLNALLVFFFLSTFILFSLFTLVPYYFASGLDIFKCVKRSVNSSFKNLWKIFRIKLSIFVRVFILINLLVISYFFILMSDRLPYVIVTYLPFIFYTFLGLYIIPYYSIMSGLLFSELSE